MYIYYQELPRSQEAFATCPQLAINIPTSLCCHVCAVTSPACKAIRPTLFISRNTPTWPLTHGHMLMKERKVICSPLQTNHFLLSAISEPSADIHPGIRKPQPRVRLLRSVTQLCQMTLDESLGLHVSHLPHL